MWAVASRRLDHCADGYLLEVRRRDPVVRLGPSSAPSSAGPRTWGTIVASFAALSVFVSSMVLFRIVYTGRHDHSAVLWNLFLAWTPFVVAFFLGRRTIAGVSARMLAGTAALWLILLPNAPYMLTDLKYAGSSSRVPVLYDVLLFSAAAWTGLLLAFASVFLMHGVARRLLGPRAGWALVICSLTLSSFGIYLGRVHRWNSWDLLVRPASLAVDVAHGLEDPRALALTALLTGFLFSGYLAVYSFGTWAAAFWRPSRVTPESRKPRLLILITLAEAGGAQTSVSLLLPGLAEQFEVTLAAHGSGPLCHAARAEGVSFVPLLHVRRPLHPWHDLLGLLELLRLCRRLRPDIVHAHSSKAGTLGRIAAALAGVPIRIFTPHSWSFGAYGGLSGQLYLWIERGMRRLTTAVVCVDHSALSLGVAARACRPERTVVIHNAVDVSAFVQGGRRNRPPRAISVGRFAFPKDFATLVEALAMIATEYRVSLVGEGPMLHGVASELRRRNLSSKVELLGARRDVPDLLASSDVFVLSSRSEGLPMSILEAMAARLPVVATDVGGVAEAVSDGQTGLLVPAGDPYAMAEALERLLRDSELRQRFGANGRKRAEKRFDVTRFRSAHVELYRRELARRNLPLPHQRPVAPAKRSRPSPPPLSVAAELGE